MARGGNPEPAGRGNAVLVIGSSLASLAASSETIEGLPGESAAGRSQQIQVRTDEIRGIRQRASIFSRIGLESHAGARTHRVDAIDANTGGGQFIGEHLRQALDCKLGD